MIETLDVEYKECLGCQGEYIPDYARIDHSISWLFEQEYVIRTKDAYRFCGNSCRIDFRARQKEIGTKGKRITKPQNAKSYHSPYSSHLSAVGMLERMYSSNICLICFSWGHITFKPVNKAFCSNHLAKAPDGFKCPIYKLTEGKVKCRFKQKEEGKCPTHKLSLVPYWNPLDETLEWLKEKPKLKEWHYAQAAQGRGLARGLDTLDRIAEELGLGNGTRILDNVTVVENLLREALV